MDFLFRKIFFNGFLIQGIAQILKGSPGMEEEQDGGGRGWRRRRMEEEEEGDGEG